MRTIDAIRAHRKVAELWDEGDNWWISTRPGWSRRDELVHSINAPTLTELLKRIRGDLTPCECDPCRSGTYS